MPNYPQYGMTNPYMPQPYPTYAQQMSQAYVQPQQAYSPPIQPQFVGLNGRIVDDEGDIKPNEIPMDGSISLFPAKDFSCIYVKKWGSDGKLYPYKFVPERTEEPSKQEETGDIVRIKEQLNRIEKLLTRSPKPKNYRKEDEKNV